MADESRELTLYVQSKRAVTTFFHTTASAGAVAGTPTAFSASAPTSAGLEHETRSDETVYFLSDDQARAVALTEEVAGRRGYEAKIVDIEKTGRVERMIAEHLRGVQKFPVLITATGHRLEGAENFTEERLAALMPTELRGVRAFTYIKVRGGDLDKIRHQLETFEQVKELHFLTGDWDMLAVLDFPSSTGGKRRVLDFVTERIRGIGEVVDTSTVVPEYSISKFPLA